MHASEHFKDYKIFILLQYCIKELTEDLNVGFFQQLRSSMINLHKEKKNRMRHDIFEEQITDSHSQNIATYFLLNLSSGKIPGFLLKNKKAIRKCAILYRDHHHQFTY